MSARRVYLDYNATAPVRPEVRRVIEPLLFGDPDTGAFGNPSSIHWAGQAARRHLERARTTLARRFGRKPSEVIFTSGGSESDNLALFGVLLHPRQAHRRLITSAIEHPAVLEAARRLRAHGVDVIELGVDRDGVIDLDALDRALETPAGLVSVMAVNNETGIVSPIDEVITRAHRRGVPVHVDAVQAIGRVALPVDADLVTISGHKLGAPKGSGALVARERVLLHPSIVGGPQERGHRAGTEPVAHAVALVTALELALHEMDREGPRLAALRARIDRVIETITGARILGRDVARVPNTTTAVFEGIDGESILQALDLEGLAASSGSACSSGSLEPSHVLLAMGVPAAEALSAVRFSVGWASTDADVDRVAEVLPALVARVRAA
ncbi:cysteine desulfurase [Myxococcota bacterium]|nr:cysteine desulfurase [Myxococcota bacterium]